MEFFEAVKKRRSIRKYLPEEIPSEVIEKCLDAALIAPNSSNMQPWEFYWVRSPEKKAKLVEGCLGQPASKNAELVVCVARIDTWRRNRKLMLEMFANNTKVPESAIKYYKLVVPTFYTYGFFNILGYLKMILTFFAGFVRAVPRGPNTRSQIFQVVVKTVALACENFMLAATAQGYGSCPMEGFDERRVKKLLGLGCKSQVVMIISVGKVDPTGFIPPQIRFDRKLFVKEV